MRIALVFSFLFFTNYGLAQDSTSIKEVLKESIVYFETVRSTDGSFKQKGVLNMYVAQTIATLHALKLVEDELPGTIDSVWFSKGVEWLTSNTNKRGFFAMWVHSRMVEVQTASEYCRLLSMLNAPGVAACNDSLLNFRAPEGYFYSDIDKIPKTTLYNPWVTARALLSFSTADLLLADLEKSFHFLDSTQTVPGHWGQSWTDYQTPYYGLAPITEAYSIYNREIPNKSRLLDFMRLSQSESGSWCEQHPDCFRHCSCEYQTALACITLMNLGIKPGDSQLDRGVVFLLEKQHKAGGWDGGYFCFPTTDYSQELDIDGTAFCTIALTRYLSLIRDN